MIEAQPFSNTLPAWSQIDNLTADIPGWAPLDQMYTLYTLALMSDGTPGGLLEIGSWCGRTSVVLAKAAIATGSFLDCIDLFPERDDWTENHDGSYSMQVEIGEKTYRGYQDQTVWKEPFESQIVPVYDRFGSIYDAFCDHLKAAGVNSVVNVMRGDSMALETDQCGPYRLAFLDGDHGYDAVTNDINRVNARLSVGGWICFDDAFSTYDGVDAAIRESIIESPQYELCHQLTRKLFVARKVS